MLYDANGRPIAETRAVKPEAGRRVYAEPSDRDDYDVSRGLTPAKLDQIMVAANGGEPADQCRLAVEIEEKNWDIRHALETRCNAVMGVEWEIEPGGDKPADKKAAEAFDAALNNAGSLDGELDSVNCLLADLMSALLPGFSVSEIVWQGGGGIAGFSFVDQKHFTFRHGRRPRLITRDNFNGVELERHKFIIHKYRRRGGDVTRGGLIRPLAWLHCFQNLNIKDLLSFVERYGMPFVVAKVDNETFENERTLLQRLIRNFGPSGGGLFSRSTELELLQAANNTGDVYFRLLEYTGAAITKVILGQTATAGDGGGWSNDGAQSQVRQDILEADCDTLTDTITMQLAAPWTFFNMPPGTAIPLFKMLCAPAEDKKAIAEVSKVEAETVEFLHRAGYETDPEEMSEKFGMKLKRASQPPKSNSISMAAEQAEKEPATLVDNTAAELINSGAADAWLGPLEKVISGIVDSDDDDFKNKLSSLSDVSDISELAPDSDSSKAVEILEKEINSGAAGGIYANINKVKMKR